MYVLHMDLKNTYVNVVQIFKRKFEPAGEY